MIFFCQAEDCIRDAQESRGLGDVYKRQTLLIGGAFELLDDGGAPTKRRIQGGETICAEYHLSLIHI